MLESKAFPDLFIPVLCFFEKKEDFITWDIEKPNRTIFWFGLVDEC